MAEWKFQIRKIYFSRRRKNRLKIRAYDGSFGVPAFFSRTLFAELTRLEGRSDAKKIINKHASQAQFLPFPEGGVDVDTPDDFSALIGAN